MIREADAYTTEHEPISDLGLMERAASTCVDWLINHYDHNTRFHLFCGQGNNGGDGWVIARNLSHAGFTVFTYSMAIPEKMSPSCRYNYEQWVKYYQKVSFILPGENDKFELNSVYEPTAGDVIIDAIFGSGLTRQPSGFAASVIEQINGLNVTRIAIDVPSGLFGDETVADLKNPAIIRAHVTLSFAPPKLAFFFPENDQFVGDWVIHDIGIHENYIRNADVSDFMITAEDILPVLRKRGKFAHKGNFGHALLICGSLGKMGAAVLAAKACIRSGAGLVTARIPSQGNQILQATVPEVMLSMDENPGIITSLPDITPYQAVAAGPGTGVDSKTATVLKLLIQESKVPILFDADAINILAMNKTWLGFLPPGCIFTPHPKEFERLAGPFSDNFERNKIQREFSARYQCYVALKGAHTAITTPYGQCWFNTTGNPGMATGGSGDVLTGIIAGLLAQGYSSFHAVLTGVYIHGLAGDLAAKTLGFESLIASDIINNLGPAFLSLNENA